MKFLAFLLLIALAISYDGNAAVNYALKYCRNYNPAYNKWTGFDGANFVSQCLKAGGFNFSNCDGKDSKGMVVNILFLSECLKKNGWKSASTRPSAFKKGYPFFMKLNDYSAVYDHVFLATKINSGSVNYAGHDWDRCGEVTISSGLTYYYL